MVNVMRLRVGQKVVIRTAANELLRAYVNPVPRTWRDESGDETYTERGEFPKVWVALHGDSERLPWPADDVFTDLAEAEARVAAP